MRNRLVVFGLVGAVALGGATLVSAVTKEAPIKNPVTLHLKADRVLAHPIDVSPTGPSVGDGSIRISDLTQNGKVIGRFAETCTEVNDSPTEMLCTGSMRVKGGQVELQTYYVRESATAGKLLKISVLGGTGIFENVTGQGVWTRINFHVTRYTITLNP